MDIKQQLRSVVDAIINGDDEAMRAAFAPVVQHKSQQILGYEMPSQAATSPDEKVEESAKAKVLREWSELDDDAPVRLQGDKVLVDGKEVGVIQTDLTDFDSGINFIETGGRFSKEFDDAQALFDFIVHKYSRGNQ